MKKNLNRVCLGCIYLNRSCDGTTPEAIRCKSQNAEARRQFAIRQIELAEREREGYNKMCINCQHFRHACEGTKCQVWTGCILTDQPPEEAEAYITTMSKYWKEAPK